MNTKIYAIWDKAVETYGQPLFCRTRQEAIRLFQMEVNRQDSMICKYPEDYSLYEVGDFDGSTGQITKEQPDPIHIATAVSLRQQPIE